MAIFKKLNIGDTVATSGTRVFKKLTTAEVTPDEPLPIWNGTDLTGTTWTIKSGWTAEAGYGQFDVKGTRRVFSEPSPPSVGYGGLHIGYSINSDWSKSAASNNITFGLATFRDTAVEIRIGIIGGTDVTNPRLIDWLLETGTLTSHQPAHNGGLYDADDNLVASWNALVYTYGMDVESHYIVGSPAATQPYVVLKKFPTGKKLVMSNSVSEIGDRAMYNCDSLTSITIGSGVTTIGEMAFTNNDNLEGIWVDSANQFFKNDDKGVLYSKTELIVVPYAVNGTYSVPVGVQSIRGSAFAGCANITAVNLPDGISDIGSYAFARCTSLASIVIPNGLKSIPVSAFASCKALGNVVIPCTVTCIDTNAFYNCTSLTDVYYRGTEEQWAAITIRFDELLLNATIHYNYTC